MVRPVLRSGAKILERETLRTGGDILTDIVRSTDENPRLNEWAKNLIGMLRERGRKSKQGSSTGNKEAGRKPRLTKRDIVS